MNQGRIGGRSPATDRTPASRHASKNAASASTTVRHRRRDARAFDQLVRCLVGTHRLCQERGTAYLVVLIPFVSQVTPEAFNVDFYTRVPPPRRDLRQPQRRLLQRLTAAEVPVLDLRPASRPVGRAAYYAGDDHWNALGHETAAAAILGQLRTRWSGRIGSDPAR